MLTNENTAIVLDSTADFPDAQERFSNLRVVPLYVELRRRELPRLRRARPAHVLCVGCARRDERRPPRSRRRRTSSRPTRSSPRYERIYSLHISSRLSGTFGSATLAAQEAGGDRVRLLDTESVSVGISMLALGIRRLLERARPTRRSKPSPSAIGARPACSSRSTRSSSWPRAAGSAGRAALAGSLLNVKPILTIADGEVVPLTRVRGRQKALAGVPSPLRGGDDGRRRPPRRRSRTPRPTSAVAQLRALVLRGAPAGQVELVTSLGAVVGTHAGPGTVGFFWLPGLAVRRRTGCDTRAMRRPPDRFRRAGPARGRLAADPWPLPP